MGNTIGVGRLLRADHIGWLQVRAGIILVLDIFTGQGLQTLALGLGDQERGEQSTEHEQGEDLHDVVQPAAVGDTLGSTLVDKRTKDTLRDDGTDLSGCGADSVGSGAVAGWEALAGNDEGG